MAKNEVVFSIKGLDCANCAASIERAVQKLDGIDNVVVDFISSRMIINVESSANRERLIELAMKTAHKVEHGLKIVVVGDKSFDLRREGTSKSTVCGDSCSSYNCSTGSCDELKCSSCSIENPLIDGSHHDNRPNNSSHYDSDPNKNSHYDDGNKKGSHYDYDHNKGSYHDDAHDDHTHGGLISRKRLILFSIGVLLFAAGIILKLPFYAELSLFLLSYFIIGGDVVLKAVKNLIHGRVFDENFLMSIATIGAFAIKEFPEGVAVMLFYQVGEFFQDMAVNRSRRSISALMDIRPDYANLKQGDKEVRVSPQSVRIGDYIIIKPGEKIPLDGRVVEGSSTLDTSALTGESIPREVTIGSEVLSGSINKNGLLTVEVTKGFGESTVSKILELVQNASSKKAPTENFITKFARWYTPAVVMAAVLVAVIPPLVLSGATFTEWVYKALSFLVVSCPCALVISIPLGFFGGIGGASKNGILVKGGNYLEALNSVETVVFDKTGTLTKGIFKVTKIRTLKNVLSAEIQSDKPISEHQSDLHHAISEQQLLRYAAYAESYSTHPIAVSILKAYGREVDKSVITDYKDIAGQGIKAIISEASGTTTVLAGNIKLMEEMGVKLLGHYEVGTSVMGTSEIGTIEGGSNKIKIESEKIRSSEIGSDEIGTVVYLAVNGVYAGYIVISDEEKEDARSAIANLRAVGISKLVMLTGDNDVVAQRVSSQLGLDEVYSELLPQQKVEKLEMLREKTGKKGKLLFVGDGINDAPVLTRADIGVAMGGLGSDAAIEAADIVIMNDEPSKLVTAIKIAKRTRRIVWQNIIFAFAVKLLVMILVAFGLSTMWEAVFADVGVALIAVLNSMRVMRSI